MTGGRRDKRGNDVGAVIAQAMKDAQSAYLLKYYPSSQNWDDKFHKLSVICNRKGVRIQTKTGYYAFAQRSATLAQEASHMPSSENCAPSFLRSHLDADTFGAGSGKLQLPAITLFIPHLVRTSGYSGVTNAFTAAAVEGVVERRFGSAAGGGPTDWTWQRRFCPRIVEFVSYSS